VKDKTIVTPNGVTCIGHTDLNSRVASVSSTLYARNLQKFLTSVGPMTTKTKVRTEKEQQTDRQSE
jgi:NAD(P) transhydrogenase